MAAMGPLYFEDFTVGQTFTTPGRTISEADVMNFAAWTGDNNQIHTDAEFAKQTRYGRRIVHGMLGASLCLGLIARMGAFEFEVTGDIGAGEAEVTGRRHQIGESPLIDEPRTDRRILGPGTAAVIGREVEREAVHHQPVKRTRNGNFRVSVDRHEFLTALSYRSVRRPLGS